MGLVAHYKLDGDINDAFGKYNLVEYLNSGHILPTSDAKLGSAYNRSSVNNSAAYFATQESIYIPGSHTIACWAKITGVHSGTANGVVTYHSHAHNTGSGITIKDISSTDFRISCNTGNGSSRTYHTYYGTSNIYNRWAHLVFRYDDSDKKISLWVDGVKEFETSYTIATKADVIAVFAWSTTHLTSASYRPSGSIDDVRIYDHALSEREVRDLALGKVLHYTFDQFQEPTENILALAGYDCTVERSGTTYPFTSYNITTLVQSKWTTTNNRISIQMESKNDVGTGYARMYVYFSDWSWATSFGVNSTSWSLRKLQNISMPDPTGKTVMFAIYHYTSGSTGKSYARNIQIEFKTTCTPFVNGSRTGAVKDQSTQGNDAVLSLANTPRWVEGGAVGSGCYHFDGTGTIDGITPGNYIDVYEPLTDTRNYQNGVTYTFWLNIDTDSVDRQSLFFGASTIRHIEIYSSSKYFRTEAGITNGYSFGSSAFPNDVRGRWSHFAIVFATGDTNSPVRWYQDGELFSSNQLGTDYFSFNKIGRSTGTSTYTYAKSLDGQIDDVRIYATALTADQVKEIYQQRASLDSRGNLLC